jgi:hypothetical protein
MTTQDNDEAEQRAYTEACVRTANEEVYAPSTRFRAFLAFLPSGACGLCGIESMRFSVPSKRRRVSSGP